MHTWPRMNGNMFQLLLIQGSSNGPNSAVHHVRWGNHIGTGLSINQRCFSQELQSFIVVDDSLTLHRTFFDDSTMSVVSVFTETHIRDQK